MMSMRTFLLAFLFLAHGSVVHGQNLIVNGDFEDSSNSGDGAWPDTTYTSPGFTSGYDPKVPEEGALFDEGTYALSTDPLADNFNFLSLPSSPDPAVGGGALVVNGAVGDEAEDVIVWQSQQIDLTPNTDYRFTTWVVNVNNPASFGEDQDAWKSSQAILQFQVLEAGDWLGLNASTIDLTDPSIDSTQWTQFDRFWNSGDNQVGAVRLVNKQTAANGNDFAMDGVSVIVVPEPSVLALIGLGAAGACLRRRRSSVGSVANSLSARVLS